jgi:chromosome segregation ATPase
MTIEELQKENEVLNARLQKAIQVFAEQKANITQLTQDKANLLEQVNQLEIDKKLLQRTLEESKQEEQDFESISQLESEKEKLQTKVDLLTETNAELQKTNTQLSEDLTEAKVKVLDVENTNKNLKELLEERNETTKRAQDDLEHIKKQYTYMEAQLKISTDYKDQLAEENVELKKKIEELTDEISYKEETLSKDCAESVEIERKVAEGLQNDKTSLESAKADLEYDNEQLRGFVTDMTNTINRLKLENGELKENIEKNEKELKDLKEQTTEYESHTKELSSELANTVSKLDTTRRESAQKNEKHKEILKGIRKIIEGMNTEVNAQIDLFA